MSNIAISVKNLSKSYTISHQTGERYTALRDVLANSAKSIGGRLLGRNSSTRNSQFVTQEQFWAINDVSFEIKNGERVGIIGRNGAGKSTLLKILSRITEPTTGRIAIKGRVSSLLEVGTGFHPELTGRENVYLNGAILGMTRQEIRRRFDEIVDFSGVEKFLDIPVKRYSSGMQVRLAFAVAAHLEPEVLLVDEVLAVGDAEFQRKCLGKMGDVAREGRTVLFVSHNMSAVTNFCNRAILLAGGETISDGETSMVISEYLSLERRNIDESDLESITNRTGTQAVSFAGFHIEDSQGRCVDTVSCGDDVTLVFCLKINSSNVRKVDIGFRLHDPYDACLVVLYSSLQGRYWTFEHPGYKEVRCGLPDFAFAPGRLTVKGRILADNQEADWPRPPIGVINVVDGDFYETGRSCKYGGASFLLKGNWH